MKCRFSQHPIRAVHVGTNKKEINKNTDIQSAEACGQTSDGKTNTPEGHRKARPYKSTLDYRHADEEWLTTQRSTLWQKKKEGKKEGKIQIRGSVGIHQCVFWGWVLECV